MLFKKLNNLLFPPSCLTCGQKTIWLCDSCRKLIRLKRQQQCYLCGRKSAHGSTCKKHLNKAHRLDGLLVAAHYAANPILKKAIKGLKYEQKTEHLTHQLTSLLKENIDHWKIAKLQNCKMTIIPIPLHPSRLKHRGFNQSELLSNQLLEQLPAANLRPPTSDFRLLQRTKPTPPQALCKSRKERLTNLKGAFQCTAKADPKTLYILLDDVCSTGTTLEECCKTLRKSGAQTVWGLVLCRN